MRSDLLMRRLMLNLAIIFGCIAFAAGAMIIDTALLFTGVPDKAKFRQAESKLSGAQRPSR